MQIKLDDWAVHMHCWNIVTTGLPPRVLPWILGHAPHHEAKYEYLVPNIITLLFKDMWAVLIEFLF